MSKHENMELFHDFATVIQKEIWFNQQSCKDSQLLILNDNCNYEETVNLVIVKNVNVNAHVINPHLQRNSSA